MKISSYPLFWIISISSIIVSSYLPIKLAAEESRQDCWISILLGGIIMMGITWVMLRVCMQNKDKTLVNFMKDLLGTVLGKILVSVYFLLWFWQMSMSTSGMVEFQNLVLLHKTPTIVLVLCMLFLVAYAVYKGGITAISRCAEVIGPALVFFSYTHLFLNFKYMEIKRILPIYADSGWIHILKGTLISFNHMVDPSIILMLFFFAENKRTASRAILWGTAVAMLWGVITTLILLFVTGPNMAAELNYPAYYLTKFITILNFIQNIDAFYITFWVFGNFIKLSVYLFILSYGLSEWTGFKNWRLIACLMTFIWLAFVIYSSHNIRISYMIKNVYVIGFFYPFIYIVIPLILWMVGSIRQRPKAPSIN
ncbi:GerAB/ArcD/ProY family transporter [Paenibacillus sp. MAH-36]|uniref:Endospore germination permease n=1 Tax=Paenibacillus violae TaxID=3077234 RepID=A0ABU3RQE4_9BACL|nr:endospore germination permease [Paenibacillus sp. PFR10]MDU0206392.1 endospore germination permease [Paenibacillus sp. PFR10]